MLALDVLLFVLRQFLGRSRPDSSADPTSANLLAPGFMAAMVLGGQLAAGAGGEALAGAGGWLWAMAAVGHLLLLAAYVGRWVTRDFSAAALNPTWFLPAAGLMTAPMTAPASVALHPILFLFGVGFSLWLILLPLVFRRVVFEPALAPKLRPTLFILAAPFGLAANALLRLTPELAPAFGTLPAAVLAYGGCFLLAALLLRVRFFLAAGVALSWWATTFPVATVAVALLRLSQLDGALLPRVLGLTALTFAGLGVAFALVATVRVAWVTCLGSVQVAARELAALRCEEAPATVLPGDSAAAR